MKSLWDDQEAAQYSGDLGLRVYTSRLLGLDKSLVLHGGGNTSVKIVEINIFGEEEDILYVKGSGWDLETIKEAGFSPVRLGYSQRLAGVDFLPDTKMVNELVTHMTVASAPVPSVEAILHAILPYKYVDHTHADAIISVTNTNDGLARIKEIYGDLVVVIPYIMPGFDLAKSCAERFKNEIKESTIGIVLMNHGIISFGETAKVSYERMIDLVARAEKYLAEHNAWEITARYFEKPTRPVTQDLAALRHDLCVAAGFPVVLTTDSGAKFLSFASHDDISTLSQQGPATPDHVIRTKRVPMLGKNIGAYTDEYKEYFKSNSQNAGEEKEMIDPVPRVILDPEFGLCTMGRTAKDAYITKDIYSHTIDIILRSTALGGFKALPASDIFDVEYWDLEQAKLRKMNSPPMFCGEIALVTGAASGIGKACVNSLLNRGAAVIGLDINPKIEEIHKGLDFLGIICDITDDLALSRALEKAVRAFGGLDMLILNAGIFPRSCRIDSLQAEEWHKVMQINLDANLTLMRECFPLLRLAPRGGRVVVIGSKNVAAPGPGVAAYSVSKAALNQLARIAALEWGGDGIRINCLHPNAVFDTSIWTDEVIASRAKNYGISIGEYKKNNVLKVEVTSQDVAELASEMCGPLFSKTTGGQISVDGGNERVI